MGKKKDNEEVVVEKIEDKSQIETCKVLYYRDGNVAFDFKGYGIQVENTLNLTDDTIKVKYTSDINKEGFTFEIIK